MRIHVETKPKGGGFVKDYDKPEDRKDLAEIIWHQLAHYELDWAAIYVDGKQVMYFTMKDLIDALQYDKYE